jgi:hypothetical protein
MPHQYFQLTMGLTGQANLSLQKTGAVALHKMAATDIMAGYEKQLSNYDNQISSPT